VSVILLTPLIYFKPELFFNILCLIYFIQIKLLVLLYAISIKQTVFKANFLMAPGYNETMDVILHIGPGDAGVSVLSIMLPG